MHKIESDRRAAAGYFHGAAQVALRVAALPMFFVMSVGAMVLIVARLHKT